MVNVVHQLPAHYKQIRYYKSMRGTIGSIFTEAEILAFLTKSLDRRKNGASVLSITSIKRPQEGAWLEREERRGDRVEAQAERSRFLIQEIRIGGILPLARIQALDECLEGRQGLCRGEGAVTGTVDKMSRSSGESPQCEPRSHTLAHPGWLPVHRQWCAS